MTDFTQRHTENNSVTVTDSTLSSTAFATGSHARASTSGAMSEDHEVTAAISELRQSLKDAQASVDRRDDELRERLELAASRLAALEEEMQGQKAKRDWSRVEKLLSGLRDAVGGLTSLTLGADALRDAVEKVIR